MPDEADRQPLLTRIGDRRQMVDAFLRSARPRAERFTYVSVISSALAAAFTAGPAVGGVKFTERVATSLELGVSEDVWRPRVCWQW